jgi:hypothetical protein
VVFVSACAILAAHAEPVDPSRAAVAARGWHRLRFPGALETPVGAVKEAASLAPESARAITANGRTIAYAFDLPGGGCIAIAADDELAPVFYYSLRHRLTVPGVPAAKGIMESFADVIARLQDGRDRRTVSAHPLWASLTALGESKEITLEGPAARLSGPKGPLLTSTWDQGAPYNNQCPVYEGQRSMVGCVATAMAQIMRYWKHPEKGTGKHCYYWALAGIAPCADFGSTIYDWANMPDEVGPFDPPEVREAVSTLSYQCGVAVDMDYSPSGSGAWHFRAALAFPKYFGYEPTRFVGQMGGVTVEEWYEIMCEQIDKGQPVLYGTVDHEFVLDGYDSPNLVHLNLGWGGEDDGWYTIDSFCSDPLNSRFVDAVVDIRPHCCEITEVVRVTGDRPQIRWKSLTGNNYTVWSCTDLCSGVWVKEADVCSQSTATCWMDGDPAPRAKFYRVEKK